jgi:hypothetical protein
MRLQFSEERARLIRDRLFKVLSSEKSLSPIESGR